MATASTSWMPAAGRHNVSIGSSLSKALKARKGQPPTQRSKNLPERDFYALRYNHKPASIDPTKPGTLEVNPGKEVTTVRVERPTVNNNEVIVFKGDEKPAKEWECVLIYDEATQTFTLEKLDSLVNLNFDVKAQSRTRPVASPHSASSSSAAQTPRRSPVRTAADELEAQLEDAASGMSMYPDADADADADGEPDPSFSLAQDEEEGEEREKKVQKTSVVVASQRRSASSAHHQKTAALAPPPPVTQAPQQSKARPTPSSKKSAPATAPQSAKAARAAAAAAASAASAPAPGQSSSKPRPRPVPPAAAPPPTSTPPTVVGSGKRAAAMENRDVEDFEIRGPIAPVTASARRSSAATATTSAVAHGSSFSLALPTASAGPDPLAHQGLYNGGGGSGAVPSSSGAAADSDDEWDEILLLDRSLPHHHHQHQHQHQQGEELTITIDDEPDDRLVDFLERELLGEDEPMGDGDGDEDEEEEMEEEEVVVGGHAHSSRVGTGPMSMNQFAGGEVAMDDDDDDYSSSEESEED